MPIHYGKSLIGAVAVNTISLYRHQTFFRHIEVAKTLEERKKGLLGRTTAGNGLFLMGAAAIHTYFMKFPIDVAYLDKKGTVIGLEEDLLPNRRGAFVKGTAHIVEFQAGTINMYQMKVGEQWEWRTGS